MLGLILGTFLNFIWKCGFPSTRPQYYDPIVNEGRIAVMTNIDMRYEEDVRRVLSDKGAERIYEPERRPL
jgi:ethanolamine utilization protein EutP (predicted NTPase)